jgi:hypothetical protein
MDREKAPPGHAAGRSDANQLSGDAITAGWNISLRS